MLACHIAFAIFLNSDKESLLSVQMQQEISAAIQELYQEALCQAMPESPVAILKDLRTGLKITEIVDVASPSVKMSKPNCFIDFLDAIKLIETHTVICVGIGCLVYRNQKYTLFTGKESFATKSRNKLMNRLFSDNTHHLSFLVLK